MISPQDRAARRTAMSQYCRHRVLTQTAVALGETATPRQEEFLLTVLRAASAQREANRRARLVARAGFPAYKTLTGLDRQGIPRPSALTWADREQGTFITDPRHRVRYGGVGTGKTHTALALGYAACERGLTVRFLTVTAWVMRLSAANRGGTADRLWQELHRADLIILDEWGYVPVDQEGAPRLFRVIADRDETRRRVITTHREFSRWGTVFVDEQMTAAMIDRLAHHGPLMVFDGESYRMKHALMRER